MDNILSAIELIIFEQPILVSFLFIALFSEILFDYIVKIILFISSLHPYLKAKAKTKVASFLDNRFNHYELKKEAIISSLDSFRLVFFIAFIVSLVILVSLYNIGIGVVNAWIIPIPVLLISFSLLKWIIIGVMFFRSLKLKKFGRSQKQPHSK